MMSNQPKMSGVECSFKSLTAPHLGELLQSQNSLTFKLLKTVADFSQSLATLHDRFGHEIQMLVETFRKRNGELRKESLFQIWELFLQQVEVNSQQHGDISRDLGQTLGNGLIERVFHRKIQSKKIFSHKERIEAILLKSNELLGKCYEDYCQAYALALKDPAQYVNEYIASHNVYVHQLQATNGMVHAYQTKTLPRLLEELEECHLDTSSSISNSLLASSELIAEKSSEQAAGYQNLAGACKQASHRQDMAHFVRIMAATPAPSEMGVQLEQQEAERNSIRYHQFQAANWQQSSQLDSLSQIDPKNLQVVPTFKNEIAPDYSQPPDQQQPKLELDREQLEEKIDKFEERIESLTKLLLRSSESRLHNKVNELQEELSQRKFDLYVAQIHLSAVRSQLQLFEYNFRPMAPSGSQLPIGGGDLDSSERSLTGDNNQQQHGSPGGPQYGAGGSSRRSPSAAGQASLAGGGGGGVMTPLGYRSKWIKAFKSLKETPGQPQQKFSDGDFQPNELGQAGQQQSQSGGSNPSQQLENQHFFQEYTFKKIASCDVCKDFLRGHMRQGVKCKLCKISCHNDCQTKAHGTIKCQQPKIKLLRRQKSAGELEVNLNSDTDQSANDQGERVFSSKPDSIYSLIRQVLDAKKRGQHHAPSSLQQQQQQQMNQNDDHHLRPHFNQTGSGGALAQSHMMNLSTGNLALANQNGKSVSTSALQHRPESSVDRWSVVMDLLAQSRQRKKEGGEGAEPSSGGASSGKRHSKQLDKFKLAARSVGKRNVQQQLVQSPSPGGGAAGSTTNDQHGDQHKQPVGGQSDGGSPLMMGGTTTLGYSQQTAQQQQQQHFGNEPVIPGSSAAGQSRLQRGLMAASSGNKQLEAPANANQPPQQLLVHHTKSLPVGQLPPNQIGGGGGANQAGLYHEAGQLGALHNPHPLHAHPQMQAYGQETPQVGSMSNPLSHQPEGVDRNPYQLLELGIAQQQIQSTSAPHSPQRKRFNLRMKSFSLDSPESPIVASSAGMYGGGGQSMAASQVGGAGLGSVGVGQPTQYHHSQQQQHQLQGQQQQQPQQQHKRQQPQQPQQPNGYPGDSQTMAVSSSSSTNPSSSVERPKRRNLPQPAAYQQQQQQQQRYPGGPFYYQSGGASAASNNYAGHQAGAAGSATSQQQQQQPHDGGYLNSYASNEFLIATSTGDASQQLAYHGQTTLRPHAGEDEGARHQQQHRHSYHNPMSGAAAYNAAGSLYANEGRLAANERRDPFEATTIAGGRHCTSALNIHHIPAGAPTGAANPAAGSATTKQTKAKQQLGSGGNLNLEQDLRKDSSGAGGGGQPVANPAKAGLKNNTNSSNNNNNSNNTSTTAANDYYDLDVDQQQQQQHKQQLSQSQQSVGVGVGPSLSMPPLANPGMGAPAPHNSDTFVVLYDYAAQRGDEIQLAAGQLIQLLETSERDWWKVRALDGSNRIGYFPSSYLAQLYQNERPLQVSQTIQVSNGETCDKLLRGQIVIHTGKQLNSFVTIRTIRANASPNDAPQALVNYIQCPEKFLLEVLETR